MASTYLTRTSGTPTNAQKGTISLWVKRTGLSSTSKGRFFMNHLSSTSYGYTDFTGGDKLRCAIDDPSTVSIQTNRIFRDTSAWYNVVWSIDTTENTASDRVKLYVNGVQETSFQTDTYPNQNITLNLFNTSVSNGQVIGSYYTGSSYSGAFEGLISHYHFIDGTAYPASTFGSTDSTTGEWKINTSPSVTYGNNGFFILKDGNTITDSSPNSNNFTLGAGTLTKTEDCPSNVFCTWNPNYRSARKDMTLTNGNTFIFEQNSGDSGVSGTIAVSSGKWYWEQIIAQVNGTNAAVIGGLHTTEDFNESPTDANTANTCGLRANGNAYKGTTNLGNFTSADPNGDIFGIAFDADNGSVYYWKNGTALNSGNAIITGLDMTKTWVPFGVQHGGARVTTSTNWGNGYFQTTAVSSAGTNASNNGIFEYDVPTGYTALSTKGLNL